MWNSSDHLGGDIKVYPEDFVVEEVWGDSVFGADYSLSSRLRDSFSTLRGGGEYLHFTLVKKNWTTIKALQYMSKRLHVSLRRFGFSGMKDSRAVTAQRISLWRVEVRELKRIKLRDVWIKDFRYSYDRIMLGDASGNRFTITIREIPHNRIEIRRILEEFKAFAQEGKVPNFFGPQRLEGGNAVIGQAIVDGDLKLAAEILLQKVQPYVKNGRPEDVPDTFWIEKRVLQHLKNLPNDYAGALRKIPRNLLKIFTYAVQSQAFNDALGRAIQEGDVPEMLAVKGFSVRRMPELSTHSIQRKSYMKVKDFEILKTADRLAKIRFTLEKGEYATTFLTYLVEPKTNFD